MHVIHIYICIYERCGVPLISIYIHTAVPYHTHHPSPYSSSSRIGFLCCFPGTALVRGVALSVVVAVNVVPSACTSCAVLLPFVYICSHDRRWGVHCCCCFCDEAKQAERLHINVHADVTYMYHIIHMYVESDVESVVWGGDLI